MDFDFTFGDIYLLQRQLGRDIVEEIKRKDGAKDKAAKAAKALYKEWGVGQNTMQKYLASLKTGPNKEIMPSPWAPVGTDHSKQFERLESLVGYLGIDPIRVENPILKGYETLKKVYLIKNKN